MADKITTPIPDIGTSWENYGGEQVEAFLKDQLTGLTNAKIGDWHLVNGADGMATLTALLPSIRKKSGSSLQRQATQKARLNLCLVA